MSNLAVVSNLVRPQPSAYQPRYAPGVVIAGKYRLEAELGEGGMATVWLAQNMTLDMPVALKLMNPQIQNAETIERFFVEGRIQARLRHPNIVHVFDFGQTELGDPFIVMERLEGVTLAAFLLERGRLNTAAAVQIMLPVIGALGHVHDNGVVHRDLKPDNIFLDRSDVDVVPKILDFGIAKLVPSYPRRHITLEGALLGNPTYMAPEQAQGFQGVDHRADIWTVCVVLYEAVSGSQAFPGDGYRALRGVVEGAVTPLRDTGAGEGALFRILACGLEKDPAFRFQSMQALGTALAQWLCDHGEAEDLYGNRISRTWKVATVPSLGPAIDVPLDWLDEGAAMPATGARGAVLSRLMLAAAIVLAGLVMSSKVSVDVVSSQHRAVDTVAPVFDSVVAEAPQALQLLAPAIAMPRAEVSETRYRHKPKRLTGTASQAELGLKDPY